jgi:hypothetical protein
MEFLSIMTICRRQDREMPWLSDEIVPSMHSFMPLHEITSFHKMRLSDGAP